MIVSAGIMAWWPASRERSSKVYLPSNPMSQFDAMLDAAIQSIYEASIT